MKCFILFTLFLIVLLPSQLNAGWIITGRYIDGEGNTIFKRYFIQNNIVKVERYNLIYTCNLKTGNIIIVDPENLVFVTTTLKEYIGKLKDNKMSRLSELLNLIPEDQRIEYERLYREQLDGEVFIPVCKDDSLSLIKTADTVKLLGYQTTKYIISEKGRKKEEFFFTDEVDISADLDLNIFLQYVYLLEPEDKTVKYRASKTYSDIVKKGFVIRRFIFEDGNRCEWQVNKIEQKNIPFYEFVNPDLCKEITLDKWLARQKNSDDKYYDDYE
jgi:hypothetical protein